MDSPTGSRGPAARLLAAAVGASFALAALPAAGAGGGAPEVAYRTRDGHATSDANGNRVATFPDLSGRFSLDGEVIAGTRFPSVGGRRVVGFNAATGERLFRINHAMLPVVIAGGRKVAFAGYGRRDPYANSLWIRNRKGRIRRVVRFSPGHGLPGVKTGMRGEAVMLDVAFDEAGRRAVVVQGNDIDLFIYDVWSIDVRTGAATRLTRGKQSRHASLSPSGARVALLREEAFCGGPEPGYRAGDIVLIAPDGTSAEVLVDGNCDVFYTNPRWLDDDTVVARRVSVVAGQEVRDSDLVAIEIDSPEIHELADVDSVGLFTVSPSLGLVAFENFAEEGGFYLLDPASGAEIHFVEGASPRLSGEHRLIY